MVALLILVGVIEMGALYTVSHPLKMAELSLGLTLVISGMVSVYTSKWYGFAVFLVYVSGVVVLFSFVCSMCPKTSNLIPKNKALLKMVSGVVFVGLVCMKKSSNFFIPMESMDWSTMGMSTSSKSGIFMPSLVWDVVVIWLGVVLFCSMVVVCSVCKSHKFPMRPFKNFLEGWQKH